MEIKSLQVAILPKPPISIFKLLGPSFILIGLGLGTGELILWPYLVANWGLGIIWGALLGITMQFFLNMEIERYALANGESVFVGFARLYKKIPIWFILSTVVAFSWPGFSAAAASVLKPFGLENTSYIAVGMLVLCGSILTLGPVLYKTLEGFQKTLVLLGIPIILFIVLKVVNLEAIFELSKGLVGVGDGYLFVPESIPLLSFLAAFAYSGAGGNLNLAQSFYIKEKGYGMGKYAGRITSLITGKQENVKLEGTTFEPNPEQVKTFYRWWKMINIEHFIVFWGLGLITILLLGLLSYTTVFGHPNNVEGINFIYNQALVITENIGPAFGMILLILTSVMLFSTQLSVIDACGRILTENLVIMLPNLRKKGNIIPKVYYSAIWMLILFGIIVLLMGTSEPQFLIVLGAVLNAFCMFIFSGILVKLNTKLLPKEIHPSFLRKVIIYITFAFFGAFSFLVIYNQFFGV